MFSNRESTHLFTHTLAASKVAVLEIKPSLLKLPPCLILQVNWRASECVVYAYHVINLTLFPLVRDVFESREYAFVHTHPSYF